MGREDDGCAANDGISLTSGTLGGVSAEGVLPVTLLSVAVASISPLISAPNSSMNPVS